MTCSGNGGSSRGAGENSSAPSPLLDSISSMMPASASALQMSPAAALAFASDLIGGGSWSKHSDDAMVRTTNDRGTGTVDMRETVPAGTVSHPVYPAGMSLRTVIQVAGNASIVAETSRDIDTDTVVVRAYLGDSIILQMPPDLADALADALTDLEPVLTWPSKHDA